MIHVMPDPHPGRCKNVRHEQGYEARRCLDYDAEPHVCRFPERRRRFNEASGMVDGHGLQDHQPRPWVRPEMAAS